MFPGVNGFHWTAGHVIFLVLFFAVAITIAATVIWAVRRTVSDFRSHHAADLCWHADFAELPISDRRCRHELAGRVISRICDNAFDCRRCEKYPKFAVLPSTGLARDLGLKYPGDRLYHRGHTWVKVEDDGSATIGLDELAEHLIGTPDAVRLPPVGDELDVNAIAWHMVKNGHDIAVRAPIEGTVLAVAGPDRGWYLKVQPRLDVKNPVTLRHLLWGPEVHGWLSMELERLQVQLRAPGSAPSLADGGVLLPGLMDAIPDADWSAALADTFLEV
ncbi:MAG TPA: hypothetical protein VKV39_11010 [Candidatus Sulfotelmatobacter sp.]|nr:hypothetical protein [Candidatus Sulfotelmatobacter sp.]